MIVVNSIRTPDAYVKLCRDWHGGSGSMMYAVASTGNLTTGTSCPVTDYTDNDDCMKKWYYLLWCDLLCDLEYTVCICDIDHEDYDSLVEFRDWVDDTVDKLGADYSLEDWMG